jgi:hypothetical protein
MRRVLLVRISEMSDECSAAWIPRRFVRDGASASWVLSYSGPRELRRWKCGDNVTKLMEIIDLGNKSVLAEAATNN